MGRRDDHALWGMKDLRLRAIGEAVVQAGLCVGCIIIDHCEVLVVYRVGERPTFGLVSSYISIGKGRARVVSDSIYYVSLADPDAVGRIIELCERMVRHA